MEERITPFDRLLDKVFPKPQVLVPAGIYHAMREVDGVPTRLHLRVEYDGSGLLMANSQAATRLTPPGTIIAKGILDGEPEETIIKRLKKRFRGADKDTMQRDMQQVQTLLKRIITPGMDYPIINFDTFLAKEVRLIAPLKVDIPLAPPDMLVPLIDKLWEVGIPNMMLLLPENPDHTHIIRAIERAEDLGMIAGVRGRGTDIQQGSLLHDMAQAGVDYITVLYQSMDASIHDALCGTGDHAAAERMLDAIPAHEVCPVVELAIVESTMDTIHETVTMLIERRIQTVSFFAIAYVEEQQAASSGGSLPVQALPQVERLVEELADDYHIQAILQPIGEYDSAVSLASQVRHGPRCSGNVSIRVEPTGAIIPAQGPYRSIGNIFTDSWEWLWADDAFYEFRERVSSWDEEEDVEVPAA